MLSTGLRRAVRGTKVRGQIVAAARSRGIAVRAALMAPATSKIQFPAGKSQNKSMNLASPTQRFMSTEKRKFKKVMSCNRGEIAIRFARAASELGLQTANVYSKEDRHSLHRYKADQAFIVGRNKTAVGAYLDIEGIVKVAVENNVDAIHPGYGFLSENAVFAKHCKDNGIKFIGPDHDILAMFGDKTVARELAIKAGVPVIPGSEHAFESLAHAREYIEGKDGIGYPVMCKAAFGGGGRGMRVVRSSAELEENYLSAAREAESAFGNGSMFVERLVERPRHVEVQLIGDSHGNAVHLFERDCSIQRRHQKIVEIAPAIGIAQETREALWADALKMAKISGYNNAGTVEFLIDELGRHYFMEVNPRIQVEHTVTEEITGIDIVQTQIKIAEGMSLEEIGLTQDKIGYRGFAIQARVTTENPSNNFAPDYGRLDVFRAGEGMGIRLDAAAGFTGAVVTPHYDSLLMKVTAHANTWELASLKLQRALGEFRVRGVSTNVPFVLNVLKHPEFMAQQAKTDFIEKWPDLFNFAESADRGSKILNYLAEVKVNGHPMPGADPTKKPSRLRPPMPLFEGMKQPSGAAKQMLGKPPPGWKQVLEKDGPAGFAKAVRQHPMPLFADTTWRDAHQSLFATRMRTIDMARIAPATSYAMAGAYAVENWGGATFDVCLRFLRECPWARLEELRELVPNIPFQMLLRSANAVGYTSYPDNVVYEFCKQAKISGMDVFRVFDSLNYVDNLLLGMDAVHKAGGVVQGEVCYTGDVLTSKKYNVDYYLQIAEKLIKQGETHVLGVKDMAGLLKPEAAKTLIGALRAEFPDTPIHVHTHDTAGTGVASMLACLDAGADVVHGAIDAMSGTTSQPSLGALVASAYQRPRDEAAGKRAPVPDLNREDMLKLHDYWNVMRGHYAPFEQGVTSGSTDVFDHEMPGGQYTNLMFQSQSMGLSDQWPAVKQAYADANDVLGDIVKVTPSSKVVGDLAQFMVTNKMSSEELLEKSSELNLPTSVVEFLQGQLGQPVGGFPEPLRSNVLKKAGLQPINDRPGKNLAAFDFKKLGEDLREKWGYLAKEGIHISDKDVISAALYPAVFEDYMKFKGQYGEVKEIPTNFFLAPADPGEAINVNVDVGKTLRIELLQTSQTLNEKGQREVWFDMNGVLRIARIEDKKAAAVLSGPNVKKAPRADKSNPGHVGAPMPGTIVALKKKVGDKVKKGEAVATLSAMKMETVVSSGKAGRVTAVHPVEGDLLAAGDLICEIEDVSADEKLKEEDNH